MAEAQAQDPSAACPSRSTRCAFVCSDWLLYRCSRGPDVGATAGAAIASAYKRGRDLRADAERSLHYAAGPALGSQQDARPGAALSVMTRPACCGGVHLHLPDVSAHQGRPLSTGRPAVAPDGPHAMLRVYQPRLPRSASARHPLLSRLFAGAHRTPGWARVAGPDLQDRHRRDGHSQLQVGRVGVPRRKAARRAHLGPRQALLQRLLDEPARGAGIFAHIRLATPLKNTIKVERVNCAMTDGMRSFAGERADDWLVLVPLVEFAINDTASPLGKATHPSTPTAAGSPAAP